MLKPDKLEIYLTKKQEDGTYKNNIVNKNYKNLSFLNKFDLDSITSII